VLSKKGDFFVLVAWIKNEKFPEPLIIVTEENLIAFMAVRGEGRDDAQGSCLRRGSDRKNSQI